MDSAANDLVTLILALAAIIVTLALVSTCINQIRFKG